MAYRNGSSLKNVYVTEQEQANDPSAGSGLSAPARTYAGSGAKSGAGLGLVAGGINAARKHRSIKGVATAALGTAGLWGFGGLMGGSLVGRSQPTDKLASIIDLDDYLTDLKRTRG